MESNQELEEVSRNVPFCTFAKIPAALGIPYNKSLGGNCAYHAGLVQKALGEGETVCPEEGVHFATIFQNGTVWFFDSSIGMQRPVDVKHVINTGISASVSAFPIINGNPSRVEVEKKGGTMIRVSYFVPSLGKSIRSTVTYDLRRRCALPAIDDRTIAALPQLKGFQLKRFPKKGGYQGIKLILKLARLLVGRYCLAEHSKQAAIAHQVIHSSKKWQMV